MLRADEMAQQAKVVATKVGLYKYNALTCRML